MGCPVCGQPTCHYWQLRQNETWHPPLLAPDDFSKGFAETVGFGYHELREELRAARDPGYKPVPRPVFGTLMFDLDYGEVYDVGLRDYGECFVSLEYARDLLRQPVVKLGRFRGTVSVAARFTNGVQLKLSRLPEEQAA